MSDMVFLEPHLTDKVVPENFMAPKNWTLRKNFLTVVKKSFEENIVNNFQKKFLLVQVQTLFQLGFFVDHQHFIFCGILCKTRYSKSLIELLN